MPIIEAGFRPVPSVVPVGGEIAGNGIDDLTDDACLLLLARAVEAQDSTRLDEAARLMARLAVTIE